MKTEYLPERECHTKVILKGGENYRATSELPSFTTPTLPYTYMQGDKPHEEIISTA